MKSNTASPETTHSLADLCVLTDLAPRTVRYYVQTGLVNRPEGETRAARYGPLHVEQLLLVKKWTAAGVSLERIRDLLHGGQEPVPPRLRALGSVEVCSHLAVADGIEVVIEPGRAGMTPEQVRHFIKGVMAVYEKVSGGQTTPSATEHGSKSIKSTREQDNDLSRLRPA